MGYSNCGGPPSGIHVFAVQGKLNNYPEKKLQGRVKKE